MTHRLFLTSLLAVGFAAQIASAGYMDTVRSAHDSRAQL